MAAFRVSHGHSLSSCKCLTRCFWNFFISLPTKGCIGEGMGAGVGAVAGACTHSTTRGFNAFIGALRGALVGGIIGTAVAIFHHGKVIYKK